MLNSQYASSTITAMWRGTAATNAAISSNGSAVEVGLFGLQTMTRRVAAVISRAIASRSWRGSASRATVIARAGAEQVVAGAVADRDPVGRDAVAVAQRSPQRRVGRVRIAVDARQRAL